MDIFQLVVQVLFGSGIFIVKRIEGIHRSPLSVLYPTLKGFSLFIRCWYNVDCKPEYLYQFVSLMGSIYMEKVMGKSNPTIGLLNIGTRKRER